VHRARLGDDAAMITLILWVVLAIVSLPLALLVLLLYPVVWLLSLPFRLVGISVGAVFDVLGSIIRLPARIIGGPGKA
jgi:hypothetical protein